MVNVEGIDDWRGQEVVDRDGEKLGKLEDVYYDVVSGQPAFITIKHGLLGRRSHLASLAGATVGRDTIRVTQTKETLEAIEVAEHEGTLDDDDIRRAAVTFGVNLTPDAHFESATLREQRRAAAAEAAQRAEELEAEAAARAQDAEVERSHAADAAQSARDAELARDDAQQAALQARADADAAHRAAGGSPSTPA